MQKTLVLLAACLLSYGVSFTQNSTLNDVKVYSDLLYADEASAQDDRLQRLNLVLPKGDAKPPLLIWIGGGAWSYVDRNLEMDLAKQLAQAGIAVASVGHRLSPAVWRDSSLTTGIQHPDHAKDIASAFKWLFDQAPQYGYDRDNLFIGGYSSGGHLAALISLDSSYLKAEGLSTNIIKGVIPVSGAYDIEHYRETLASGGRPELAELHVDAVFGATPQALVHASPTSYLERLSAPWLVICDNNLYNYTRLLEDRIRATAFRNVQVVYAYNLSHGGLWKNLSFGQNSIYRQLIIDFIKKQSGPA